jgi:protein-disulfide isomerase
MGSRRVGGAGAPVGVLLALALGACGGDLSSGLATPEVTGAARTPVSAPGEPVAAPTPAFNPFAPEGTTDGPAREVIANPSLAEVLQPGPLPELSLGRADAPVVMVKYMSLTCPHCRRFMADTFPALRREYIDTGKVRLVIREFPIGKTSGSATIALRCAPMSEYLTLYNKFLAQQGAWVSQEVRVDAIHRVAAQVGLGREALDACLANREMIEGLKQVKERGRQLGIIGTPNFFIGNRLEKTTLGIKEIRALVDPMLAGRPQPSAPGAG